MNRTIIDTTFTVLDAIDQEPNVTFDSAAIMTMVNCNHRFSGRETTCNKCGADRASVKIGMAATLAQQPARPAYVRECRGHVFVAGGTHCRNCGATRP